MESRGTVQIALAVHQLRAWPRIRSGSGTIGKSYTGTEAPDSPSDVRDILGTKQHFIYRFVPGMTLVRDVHTIKHSDLTDGSIKSIFNGLGTCKRLFYPQSSVQHAASSSREPD